MRRTLPPRPHPVLSVDPAALDAPLEIDRDAAADPLSFVWKGDAFNGYNDLYEAKRKPAPILEAACWSHGRRKFFDLAKSGEAPIAAEAVRRIDELFEIERTVNGKTPEQRLTVHREKSKPLLIELGTWLRQQRALLSSSNDTAKAINYLFNRWAAFTRFLDDGRVCLTNNAAERACAAWRSEERIEPSPVQMLAAIVPRPSIPLSKPAR